ncbi:MAG TPA: M48 family metalloprotease [Polyangia bacterium]
MNHRGLGGAFSRSWVPVTAMLVVLVGTNGCSSQSAAELLVSPEQENLLGAQIKAGLEKGTAEMPAIKYLQDPELRAYILGLADKVVALGKVERPEFTWKTEVIDDPTQVNAFATPGGYLYIFSGLLRAADNEAEVVGVMGHEVGHVLARHYARQLVKTYTLQGLIALALGEDANGLSTLAANLLAQGYLLSHSRAAETESDEYGARLASQAGYDPNALGTFFAKLQMLMGETPAVLKYVMGHPLASDRQAHITSYIAEKKLTVGATNAAAFQMMRAKLPAGLPMGMGDAGARDAR